MKINHKIVGEPEDIIKNNFNIVWSCVNRFRKWCHYVIGVDEDDLFSTGCIGLIKAYEQFDPDKGASFESYAYSKIASAINRYILEYNSTFTYPRRAREMYYKLFKMNLLDKTIEEIKKISGMKGEDIEIALHFSNSNFLSLNYLIINNEEEKKELLEFLKANEEFDINILLEQISFVLNEREYNIFYLHYIMNYSQREVGEKIGLSQVQVGRILKDIKEKLRQFLEIEKDSIAS